MQVNEVHKLVGEFLKSGMLKMSHFEVDIAKFSKNIDWNEIQCGIPKINNIKST
jgi:hypothetical protein